MSLRPPLFCDTGLARRIERAEAELMTVASAAAAERTSAAQRFPMQIGGGMATYAAPGSPFNKVVGLGFGGVPSAADLEDVERAFADCNAAVQIELPHLAEPAIGALLTARGYRLTSFENVLGCRVVAEAGPVAPGGLEVRASGEDELERWLDVVIDGVTHPDLEGLPSHEAFSRLDVERAERAFVAAGVERYVAVHDGVFASGASIRIAGRVAQLTGAATAPAHRRRGAQGALLAARVQRAAAAGCDIAVVATRPASSSQRNVQRRGFELLYARAVLVKGR